MFDVIKIRQKRRDEKKVERENRKKERDNRSIFMTSHMTLPSAFFVHPPLLALIYLFSVNNITTNCFLYHIIIDFYSTINTYLKPLGNIVKEQNQTILKDI